MLAMTIALLAAGNASAGRTSPADLAASAAAGALEAEALTLRGTLRPSRLLAGTHEDSLLFEPVDLSLHSEMVLALEGRGDPDVEHALDALEAIAVPALHPQAEPLREACHSGCTLEASIRERGRGDWVLVDVSWVKADAPAPPLDVAVGDARRRPLLDALRAELEPFFGQPLRFRVSALREADGFAYAEVRALDAADRPIDLTSLTALAERASDGWLDGDGIYALLRGAGRDWRVLELSIAPTDVAWADWTERFDAPHRVVWGETD